MAKAKNEDQALEHMTLQHARHQLSGQFKGWTKDKADALDIALASTPEDLDAPTALELGVGDLSVMRHWAPFLNGGVRYTGVDFVPSIIERSRDEFPEQGFMRACFSAVPFLFNEDVQWDIIVMLDVLYHIPEDGVHDRLVDFAFKRARHAVVVSYATDMRQVFDGGRGPGDAGFCWFPREFQLPTSAADFTSVYQQDADTMQKQKLEVFIRG